MGQKSRNKKNHSGNKQKNKQASTPSGSFATPAPKASILQGNASIRQAQPAHSNSRTSMTEHMEYVRSDIIRIVQLLAIMGLILIGLALFNAKTPVLRNTGEKLSNFMRLQ